MTNIIFNIGKLKLMNGDIDLLNDSIKIALMTETYSPDKDNDEYYSDLVGEASGTGYTAGGKVLSNRTISKDDLNDRAEFKADDLVWNAITVSNVNSCVIYKDTGTPSTSSLIAYIDFAYSFQKISEDLIINWDAEGILNLEGA